MNFAPFAFQNQAVSTLSTLSIEYLIVGGGAGAAGSAYDPSFARTNTGGGSGGGIVTGSLTLSTNTTYPTIIGEGGAAALTEATGYAGNSSEFNSISAAGGNGSYRGTGGTNPTSPLGGNGGNGASNGFSGYTWLNGSTYAGGGGGGNGNSATRFSGGAGGGGQGGNDVEGTRDGDAGTANTGGGGGGASFKSGVFVAIGNAGGSGVVIVRYSGTPVATGGTITQSGGYTYHTFTTSSNLIT
jgi:hypothetical protein